MMPYIKIHIPNGKKCYNNKEYERCRFNERGTVLCELFGVFLEEIDDYTNLQKCEQCQALSRHKGADKNG